MVAKRYEGEEYIKDVKAIAIILELFNPLEQFYGSLVFNHFKWLRLIE